MNDDTIEIDAEAVFRKSRKFDLVYKIALARAWIGGDARQIRRASLDYLEMQRARFSFFENTPRRTSPADFMDSFRKVAYSIRSDGFSPDAAPVHLEKGSLELIDGHHRLAACIASSRPCRFAYGEPKKRRFLIATFRTFRKGHIAEAVENDGVRGYLKYNESARIVETTPVPGENEESAISRVESELGCIVWHSRPLSGEAFAFTVSPLSQESKCAALPPPSQDTVDRLFPALPEPDWRKRAAEAPTFAVRLEILRYTLAMPFKFGRRREKAKWHLEELACRLKAYSMLADYAERSLP
jgi:hypothetical protein